MSNSDDAAICSRIREAVQALDAALMEARQAGLDVSTSVPPENVEYPSFLWRATRLVDGSRNG